MTNKPTFYDQKSISTVKDSVVSTFWCTPGYNASRKMPRRKMWVMRVTLKAGVIPRFQQHEATRSISTPPWMAFAGFTKHYIRLSRLYTWVERGSVPPMNTSQWPWPGLDAEVSAITTSAPMVSFVLFRSQIRNKPIRTVSVPNYFKKSHFMLFCTLKEKQL